MEEPSGPISRVVFGSLPTELLLYIIAHACDSQSMYRILLILNWRIHHLTKLDRLPCLPISITVASARPFHEMLTSNPNVARRIRYLWITGTSTQLCADIAASCPNLVSLACGKTVLYRIISMHRFEYESLTELTLFDSRNCWTYLKGLTSGSGNTHHRSGYAFCRRITHLRVHDPLTPDFDAGLFTSLTHYSCSFRMPKWTYILEDVLALNPLPNLKHIVLTTFFWKNEPPDGKSVKLAKQNDRIRILFFGEGEADEFTLWSARALGKECIWTKRDELRQLT